MYDENVAGSPFTVVVNAGKPDPSKCSAYDTTKTDLTEVGGLTGGKAGKQYHFRVVCQDAYGNEAKKKAVGGSTSPFNIKIVGVNGLFWGKAQADDDGRYTIYYTVPIGGTYEIHTQYRLTDTTYVSISGSPSIAEIVRVKCPIVLSPVSCDGHGKCNDDGTCSCDSGFDGEYCQTDLAKMLRMAIVLENALLGSFVMILGFSYIWRKCVQEKQLFERLAHDDAEEDW